MELGPNPLTAIAVLAYLAGGVTLWKLIHWFFEFPEKYLASDTKDAIALWLLDAKPPEHLESWPRSFARIFDSVFTKRRLSWTCFWRSSVASLVSVAIVFVVSIPFDPTWRQRIVGGYLFTTILNLFPDYLSLMETRFLIRLLERKFTPLRLLMLLVLDFVATAGIFAVFVWSILYPLAHWLQGYFWGIDSLYRLPLDWQLFLDPRKFLILTLVPSSRWFYVAISGVHLYSTFFTSAWLWLYALSGVLARALLSFGHGAVFLRDHLNVEERPLSTMGLVAGGLAAFCWWGICLVSWLVAGN